MDEPLLGAGDCKVDLAQAAKNVAAFARQVQAAYPAVSIGDVEPYPQFGVPTLTAWMAALQAEGFAPAFLHLDVDRQRAASSGFDVVADLRTLEKLVDVQRIPFGVIFWGADGTDEAGYAADVLAWVEHGAPGDRRADALRLPELVPQRGRPLRGAAQPAGDGHRHRHPHPPAQRRPARPARRLLAEPRRRERRRGYTASNRVSARNFR